MTCMPSLFICAFEATAGIILAAGFAWLCVVLLALYLAFRGGATMIDRELLELAAKAAGMKIHGWITDGVRIDTPLAPNKWSPLTDDGDALRLAVKLDFRIDIDRDRAWAAVYAPRHLGVDAVLQTDDSGDPYAATRRAIVMAAAEIGRTM